MTPLSPKPELKDPNVEEQTLKAQKIKKQTTTQTPSNNVLSSAALVAGTTVGAGVLALPAVTLPVGFWPSSVLMLGAWLYMVASGLLIAEATLQTRAQTRQQTGESTVGLLATIQNSLGKGSAIAAGLIYIFIHYALLIAYVARGGDILAFAMDALADKLALLERVPLETIPLWWGHVVFVVVFANILFWGRDRQIARLNNILVAVVILSFVSLFAFTFGQADITRLQVQHWEKISAVVPVMFVAFVYQNVVPVITKKLEGNRQQIRQSIWFGSLVPLVMFGLWNAVILASIPLKYQAAGGLEGGLDPLEWLRMSAVHPGLGLAVAVFSEVAIATSFIGFVFGLLDVFEDVFSAEFGGKLGDKFGFGLIQQNRKLFFYALTFVPPLLLSLLNPNIFYDAIDFAGAFGISLLFGVIPAVMVWRLRDASGAAGSSVPLLRGGRPLLVGMIAIAVGVIVQKLVSFGN